MPTKTRRRKEPQQVRASREEKLLMGQDDDWEITSLGGSTQAGIAVNRDVALTYSAIWRAVNLISRDVAKLPLHVLRRTEPSGKERDAAHPAYVLLRRKPNPYFGAFIFRQTLQAHVLLHGNGYAWIERDRNATPLGLYVMNPERTYPVRENGTLYYVTSLTDGSMLKIVASDVLHIRGLGFDGLVGYSVIDYAKQTIGLGIAARGHAASYYGKGARPSVLLTYPYKLDAAAKDNLLRSWNSMFSGVNNAHKTALLEDGVTAVPFSVNARDSQFLESRQFEIREVANWFGLPPHKLGDTTRTSYNSLEQEQQSYLDESLDGCLVPWEEECGDKLLTEQQKDEDSHLVEFERGALLRVDYKTQTDSLVQEVTNGIRTPDEVRALRNLPPYPNGIGSKPMFPVNLAPLGEPRQEPTPPPGEPEPQPAPDDGPQQDESARYQKLGHIAKRIADKALRASLKSERYVQDIDAAIGACDLESIRVIVGDRAEAFVAAAKDSLLRAAECRPVELRRRVERSATWICTDLVFATIAGKAAGEESEDTDGT